MCMKIYRDVQIVIFRQYVTQGKTKPYITQTLSYTSKDLFKKREYSYFNYAAISPYLSRIQSSI